MASIKFSNVSKIYEGKTTVIENLNLEIKDKEFVILVGPSGCGKSTTLRMIAGLEDITAGEFYIDGKLANQMTSRERGIAMVFQSYALYPQLTVYENLAFGLMLEGIDADVIEEKVQATAKILGLTDYLERFPRNLSGGQCQRVAIARAIVGRPKIILADEPTGNLDSKMGTEVMAILHRLNKEDGITIIMVTHNEAQALETDRIVRFFDGRIIG